MFMYATLVHANLLKSHFIFIWAISIAPFTPKVRVVRSFRNYSPFPWNMSFGRASLDVAPGLMARHDP